MGNSQALDSEKFFREVSRCAAWGFYRRNRKEICISNVSRKQVDPVDRVNVRCHSSETVGFPFDGFFFLASNRGKDATDLSGLLWNSWCGPGQVVYAKEPRLREDRGHSL